MHKIIAVATKQCGLGKQLVELGLFVAQSGEQIVAHSYPQGALFVVTRIVARGELARLTIIKDGSP
jgi:hypothetical protein